MQHILKNSLATVCLMTAMALAPGLATAQPRRSSRCCSRTRPARSGARRNRSSCANIGNYMKADPAYGKGVADALGIDIAAETG